MNIITDNSPIGDKNTRASLEHSETNKNTTMKPRIYLAGKIGKNDWRDFLVRNLRNTEWCETEVHTERFTYVGPFFFPCNHGCRNQPNNHGAVGEECCVEVSKNDVVARNNAGLDAADLLFVYLTSCDCYGTLLEIGWALKSQTRVVLCFSPDIEVDDFWYAEIQADAVYLRVLPQCLGTIFSAEITNAAKAMIVAGRESNNE